jgi:hypothetical protein
VSAAYRGGAWMVYFRRPSLPFNILRLRGWSGVAGMGGAASPPISLGSSWEAARRRGTGTIRSAKLRAAAGCARAAGRALARSERQTFPQ